MRWIVGLDTRDLCDGAIAFAAWLRERASAPSEFIGIHILDRDAVASILGRRDNDIEHLQSRARDVIAGSIAEAAHVNPLARVDVVSEDSAQEGLGRLAVDLGAAGLMIGRRAGRVDGALVRLGRTGRRLLRHLPLPVVVVPPDLDPNMLGDGPVLCAVDLHERSVAAAMLASKVASELGRRLRILHVVRLPETLHYYRGDRRLRQELVDDLRCEATRSLEQWCEAHGLTDGVREVLVGDPGTTLHDRVDALRAPLVVCGSRRLTLTERVFNSSLGTYLAATLPVPMLVVPEAAPDESAAD